MGARDAEPAGQKGRPAPTEPAAAKRARPKAAPAPAKRARPRAATTTTEVNPPSPPIEAATGEQAPATQGSAEQGPAEQASAKRAPAKRAAAKKAPSRRTPKAVAVTPPVAIEPEDAWTSGELTEVRTGLQAQAEELRGEIERAASTSAALQRNASGEGSGDEADAGSKTFEREHEMSIANNSRDLLTQVERALAQIEAGTYGRCEACGNPIAKARLQAFPRATLCVKDKEREERR